MLADAYADVDRVTVCEIPGLHFSYRGQRLDYFKSCCSAVPYLWQMRDRIGKLERLLQQERPDLAITDFEPLLPRAAQRCGIPYVSFDHQHFLVVNDLSELPWLLRWKARLLAPSVRLFYCGQRRTIVSSFYRPPLKPNTRNVTQTGVLLRPEILHARPVVGDFVLVYMRRFLRENLWQALQRCGRPVRIYGLGEHPSNGNLQFRQVDECNFIDDLIHCYAVVSNAGNQLVGESLYLKKPFLALPESGNFEQSINAHFVRQSGGGDAVPFRQIGPNQLQRFLERVPEYRRQIRSEAVAGNTEALEAILSELSAVKPTAFPLPAYQAA
jgi:uncharacterized protein (TIGR00661 family)